MKVLNFEDYDKYSVKLTMTYQLNYYFKTTQLVSILKDICNSVGINFDDYINASIMALYRNFCLRQQNENQEGVYQEFFQTKYFKFHDLNKVMKVLVRFFYRLKVYTNHEDLTFSLNADTNQPSKLIITLKKEGESENEFYLNMNKVFEHNYSYSNLIMKATGIKDNAKYTEDMLMRNPFTEQDVESIKSRTNFDGDEIKEFIKDKFLDYSNVLNFVKKPDYMRLEVDTFNNFGISYNIFLCTFSRKEITAYIKFCIGMTERGLNLNRVGKVKESENHKFTMRNLIRKLGFNGDYNSDVRFFMLKNLTGNSAKR